jgi:UDP-GlcNAc3NAcA epimerase
MKLLTIVGARPQFVKAAALSRALKEFPEITEVIIHTGQHYDEKMSDIFFTEMEIPKPSYSLGVGGCAQGAMTGRMLEKIEEILVAEKPDCVLVFGDTNSTLAGALAAVKLHIPIAHVEAGLRSFNRKMPEEINRVLTDQCSTLLFTPSESACKNLRREGILEANIFVSGDIMLDAITYYSQKAQQISTIRHDLNLDNYVLATVHRAENTDSPKDLEGIMKGLSQIASHTPVIFPLHPRTEQAFKSHLSHLKFPEQLRFIPPVGYFDMLSLQKGSKAILTDSGGIQKEAYWFSKPCITLRNETEWEELVEEGYNTLTGSCPEKIVQAFQESQSGRFPSHKNLYGDGHAAKFILKTILNHFKGEHHS